MWGPQRPIRGSRTAGQTSTPTLLRRGPGRATQPCLASVASAIKWECWPPASSHQEPTMGREVTQTGPCPQRGSVQSGPWSWGNPGMFQEAPKPGRHQKRLLGGRRPRRGQDGDRTGDPGRRVTPHPRRRSPGRCRCWIMCGGAAGLWGAQLVGNSQGVFRREPISPGGCQVSPFCTGGCRGAGEGGPPRDGGPRGCRSRASGGHAWGGLCLPPP